VDLVVSGQNTRAVERRDKASAQASRIRRSRWWRLLSRIATTALLPLITAIATAIAAVNHGPVRVYWSLGAFVAIAMNGLISYNKDRIVTTIRDVAVQLRTDLATALNDTGQPLVAALGNVTSAASLAESKSALAVLIDRAVSLAQTEIARSSSSRTRAAFYCIEGERLERRVYHSWTGSDAPRREFVRGRSEHDDEVMRFAHGENALLVKDLENHPPPHFADFKGRSYKSFVSVPVRAGSKSFGLLTADADRPEALSEIERGFLILIAGALGAGMAHVDALEAKPSEKGT
jgi:GAF domain-containing protein